MKKIICVMGLLAAPAAALAETTPPSLQDLDTRLRALEQAQAAVPAPAAPAAVNAFNPALSVILTGTYAHHSLDPDSYALAGFPVLGEGGPVAEGLAIGESEIGLAANVDDKFSGQLTLAIASADGSTELGVEEAYVDSTALPAGLVLRMGRFFSNIGYLNTHHAHTDKFVDRPLAYQALLGNQYGDDGLQLRWLAPTDLYLELSAEALRGGSLPNGGRSHDGVGVKTVAAHVGGDVGSESSWLAGLSLLHADSANGDDGFSGRDNLYIADLTWKWAPQGNFKDGGVTLHSEYLQDNRDGSFVDPAGLLPDQAWTGNRRGAYVEATYRLNRQWETGYRYDRLWPSDSGPDAANFDADRHSLALTWLNSEFSLLRLQLSHERPTATTTDNALILQYQVSLGAHGAHAF